MRSNALIATSRIDLRLQNTISRVRFPSRTTQSQATLVKLRSINLRSQTCSRGLRTSSSRQSLERTATTSWSARQATQPICLNSSMKSRWSKKRMLSKRVAGWPWRPSCKQRAVSWILSRSSSRCTWRSLERAWRRSWYLASAFPLASPSARSRRSRRTLRSRWLLWQLLYRRISRAPSQRDSRHGVKLSFFHLNRTQASGSNRREIVELIAWVWVVPSKAMTVRRSWRP